MTAIEKQIHFASIKEALYRAAGQVDFHTSRIDKYLRIWYMLEMEEQSYFEVGIFCLGPPIFFFRKKV